MDRRTCLPCASLPHTQHHNPPPGPGLLRPASSWHMSGAHVLLMIWNFSPFWKLRSSSVLAS